MRADRMGTKLLYDSLGKLPGIEVERNFLPVEFWPRDEVTVLLLGVNPLQVDWDESRFLRQVEEIATRGNRLVVALYEDPDQPRLTQQDLDIQEEESPAGARKAPARQTPGQPPLGKRWNVRLKVDPREDAGHPLYIERAEGWKVLDQAAEKILAVERDFGKGSIVLMAESWDFTNASVVELDRLKPVSARLGPFRHILFDENHLGVAESGSIVGMARQFRLMGLALGLALCAGIFIWKNGSSFPPAARVRRVPGFSGRTSQEGLLTLLKRHIAPAELAAVCWREWLSANGRRTTPELRRQAGAILAAEGVQPVKAMREIQSLLDAKGKL